MGSLRVLELFCGLGGAAAALEQIRDAGGGASEVVAAVDLSDPALAVYRFNHPEHPIVTAQIGALSSERLAAWRADLWWMSPPCQPYTRRGLRRDLDDPRARILPAVLERLVEVRPRYLALENVPGFAGSRAHAMLREALACGGYGELVEATLCPSRLGMPNRRERFYCVASRGELAPLDTDAPPARRPLVDLLDTRLDAPPAEEPPPELRVAPELLARYEGALDLVDPADPNALTACFTSAYGRSPVRSGSYLRTPRGVRRFSPREILRLLGFPERFAFPADLPTRLGWRLAGNSLALAAVRRVLRTIPELC